MNTINIKGLYDEARQEKLNAEKAEEPSAQARREAWENRAKDSLKELMELAEIVRPQSFPFILQGEATHHKDGEGYIGVRKIIDPAEASRFDKYAGETIFGYRLGTAGNGALHVVFPENPYSTPLWADYIVSLVKSCAKQ